MASAVDFAAEEDLSSSGITVRGADTVNILLFIIFELYFKELRASVIVKNDECDTL